MAELADAADLKSAGGDTLWVQVPLALQVAQLKMCGFSLFKIHLIIFISFFNRDLWLLLPNSGKLLEKFLKPVL